MKATATKIGMGRSKERKETNKCESRGKQTSVTYEGLTTWPTVNEKLP